MTIKALIPVGRREWTVFGLGALAAVLAIGLLLPRYDVRPAGAGLGFLRVDSWTGGVEACFETCRPVGEGAATSSQ